MFHAVSIHPHLTPYIKDIRIQDTDVNNHHTNTYTIFPSPYPVMGFQYQGELSVIHDEKVLTLAQSGITGLQMQSHQFQAQHNTRTILITFSPYGAFPLLKHPMNEITDRNLGLEAFLKSSDIKLFEEQLHETNDMTRLSILIQDFLLAQLEGKLSANDTLKMAVMCIVSTHGSLAIESLAQKCRLSRRQLERLFQVYVGISPKAFASLVRFDWARRHILHYPSSVDLALVAGYSDQAHLIRQFTRYTHLTPRQYKNSHAQNNL